VVADPDGREALGSLIGRKGERLSALQHLVNLMLSRRMGEWTRVLVDVEDYRGRRERQLRDLANRAAARVDVETGETSRLNVLGAETEKEELGALIGRKGERLSALQHLVNLMLSRQMGAGTRVLVDVEDYRGRRERQLREIAERAAAKVVETGKMLQLEPMPALERRWIHIALRDHPNVATQSIGEEPNRRVVVVPRSV
jgi:spoIIIJ-associated protein